MKNTFSWNVGLKESLLSLNFHFLKELTEHQWIKCINTKTLNFVYLCDDRCIESTNFTVSYPIRYISIFSFYGQILPSHDWFPLLFHYKGVAGKNYTRYDVQVDKLSNDVFFPTSDKYEINTLIFKGYNRRRRSLIVWESIM